MLYKELLIYNGNFTQILHAKICLNYCCIILVCECYGKVKLYIKKSTFQYTHVQYLQVYTNNNIFTFHIFVDSMNISKTILILLLVILTVHPLPFWRPHSHQPQIPPVPQPPHKYQQSIPGQKTLRTKNPPDINPFFMVGQ